MSDPQVVFELPRKPMIELDEGVRGFDFFLGLRRIKIVKFDVLESVVDDAPQHLDHGPEILLHDREPFADLLSIHCECLFTIQLPDNPCYVVPVEGIAVRGLESFLREVPTELVHRNERIPYDDIADGKLQPMLCF